MTEKDIEQKEGEVKSTPLISFVDDRDPEQRTFLVLLVGTDEKGDSFKEFEFITGRTAAYDYIKRIIESIDVLESKIIAGTDIVNNAKPVAKFMKYCVEEDLVDDPGFDITDYMGGSYDGVE